MLKIYTLLFSILIMVNLNLAEDIPKPLSAQEYFVPKIPDVVANVTQFAGLIPIRKDANIFFWLFENEKKVSNNKKLTIWLNGGPGCSSMDGVFMENGPYTFDEDDHIINNPYSWNKYSNMLYVDQPLGTGYSYTKNNDIPDSEIKVGKDFRTFIEQFFKVFPQYENSEIYIAGESFAGTYIPYIADTLINNDVNGRRINLKGLAIGNGWIDPLRQYQGYLKYSVDNNILSGSYLTRVKNYVDRCTNEYNSSDTIKKNVCENILDAVLDQSKQNGKHCINMYDIRLSDNDSTGGCGLYSWPLTLNAMTKYLGRNDVIEALHVKSTPHIWRECSSRVSRVLSGDDSRPAYTLFPELLKHLEITLFAGDKDLICNHVGIEMMIENLEWNGYKGFRKGYSDWIVDGVESGLYQSERNLTYIRMANGSHMVAIDMPEESLYMFNSFIGVNMQGRKSTLGNVDFETGYSDSIPANGTRTIKILSVAAMGTAIICGISLMIYKKIKKTSSIFETTEWHELAESDNEIQITIDDNSLSVNNDKEEVQ